MLKHIYPESAEKNVKVCCWKTTDDALEYECNLKLNSSLTISEIIKNNKLLKEVYAGQSKSLKATI